jgi:hypothetical protein
MLRKYSIFMMLLLTTASLVGISSMYQPTNVETQPGTEGTTQLPRDQQKSLDQAMSDKQLLDRLMPLIINRLDSKMLAEKILPHLDLKVVLTQRPGQAVRVVDESAFIKAQARCLPGETAVSAGFYHGLRGSYPYVTKFEREVDVPNVWTIISFIDGSGGILHTYAECLTVELALKPSQPLNLLNLREKGSK